MKIKRKSKQKMEECHLPRKRVCVGCGKGFFSKDTAITFCSAKCRRRNAYNRSYRDQYYELNFLGLQ